MSDPFKPGIEDLTKMKLKASEPIDAGDGSDKALPSTALPLQKSEDSLAAGDNTLQSTNNLEEGAPPFKTKPANNQEAAPALRRKKKFPAIVYQGLTVLTFLPILATLAFFVPDPASWDYFSGKYFRGGNDQAAVIDYSNALRKRRSMQFLQERADSYGRLGQNREQSKDLQELIDNKVQNGSNYLDLATYKIKTEGESSKTQKLLEEAFRLKLAHCKSLLASLFPDTHMLYSGNTWASTIFSLVGDDNDQYREAAWDLVACGRSQMVLDALQKPGQFSEKHDRLLKAMALRETNKTAQSMLILNDRPPLKDLSDWRWPSYEFFEALSALDRSDTATASKWVKQGWDTGWLNNLPAAWLAFEQGKYNQALKLTEAYCKYAEAPDSVITIMERQEVGAAHLLKAHIYLKLNKAAKASEEFGKYKKQGSKGTIFIPKIYRHWLNEFPK